QRDLVEFAHLRLGAGREAHMHAVAGMLRLAVMRRADPELRMVRAIADGVRREIGDALEAEGLEHRVVEFGRALEIGDADRNMMEHGQSLRLNTGPRTGFHGASVKRKATWGGSRPPHCCQS